jgi:NADP-dependent 3-hydroxy acid dehydrogenase YdfG
MFAAIRGEWDIERDDAVALRDYPTLRAVIGFVHERRPDLAPGQAPVGVSLAGTEPVSPSTTVVSTDEHQGEPVLERRVPIALARPPASLCADTGVELGEGSRVIVAADAGGVGSALADRLAKRGVEVLLIDDAPDAAELVARIDAWRGGTPVTGVYWLRALDAHGAIEDMDLETWREELRVRVKLLFETMRHVYDDVAAAGTFLVSATRLGGRFGFDEHGPVHPMGGAVSGFTKTFKRERPEALVKVVDVPASRKTAAFADILIEETLVDPGAVEVGRTDDGMRWTVGLGVEQLPEQPEGMHLGPESVFVVTGAAGSIVSAITADLAAATGGVFHLMDLVPQPDRGNEDLAMYRSDPDALRLTIFERLKASGERATPAVVEREMNRLERASAALDAIEAIEVAGGTVHYHSVNLLDRDAMAETMAEIAEMHERVDVLLHAGGLEISRLLPDKDRSEYDLVFDVKADGWFNLIAGLSGTEIGATVAFSSIAGRFGNAGQSDYSAANDLLCKYALSFRESRPDTIGLAIDWTAWGDIGMATRGSIPTIMKAAGIDMLPAALGVPFIREELTGASGSREMLVAQRLGMLTGEWGETAGIDPDAFTDRLDAAVMADRVVSFGIHEGLTTTVDLDPTQQGFLFDHRIDGTPVLPGVMGVEAFAEVASLPWDDLVVAAVEEVEFLAPFKFYKDEPRTVTVTARFAPEGDDLVAHCALVGSRTLPTGPDPVVTVHFTGKVRLSSHRLSLSAAPIPDEVAGVGAGDLYEVYFHGPTYQVLDRAWRSGDLIAGALAAHLPPNHEPTDRATVTNPRLLELCFQTVGAFEMGTTGTMALPMRIGSVTYGEVDGNDSAMATAVVSATDGGFTATVVTDAGPILRLDGYRTVRLPGTLDDSLVAPLQEAMGGDA